MIAMCLLLYPSFGCVTTRLQAVPRTGPKMPPAVEMIGFRALELRTCTEFGVQAKSCQRETLFARWYDGI